MRMQLPNDISSKLLRTPPVMYLRKFIAGFKLNHPGLIRKLPNGKQVKRFTAIILALFFVIVILLVLFRRPIVGSIMHSKIESFNTSHHAELKIGSFQFRGLLGIELNNISLKPQVGDTLLTIKYVEAQISLARLFRFKLGISEMSVENTRIS